MSVQRLYIEYLDAANGFYRSANYLADGADPSAIVADIEGVSNAGVQQHTAGTPIFDAVVPLAAQYPFVSDNAVLSFICADGSTVQLIIPAPSNLIFFSDQLRVDPAAIATLILDVIASVVNTTGSAVTAFVYGVRSSRANAQKG